MKKIIFICFNMLAVCQAAFAQTETEKLFQTMAENYKKNPKEEISKNAAEDFVLISGNGYMANKAKTVEIFKHVKNVDASFDNLKLRQYGNTLIATGNEHSVRHYDDGTPDYVSDYWVTYVYEIKEGKLIMLSAQHTAIAK